jgi:hypothetical protein
MAATTGRENSWVKRMATFVGGGSGVWRIARMKAIRGPPLERVDRLAVFEGNLPALPLGGGWVLRGVTSNERYTRRREHDLLTARQPLLGRPEATRGALIPVTKSESWWQLSQDERRAIFETKSGHIRTGLKYLPSVARRLYHCRDLGEPFDFLTWFEYAPEHADAFEELVGILRRSEEWSYVEREVDIRLARAPSGEADRPTAVEAGKIGPRIHHRG